MTAKLIFLSHIHEEKELAILIKDAIEDEFSGFVDVFVSSDGTTIPAGHDFLKKVEEGLANCIGALYLISPKAVQRPWINFELGAVWIRSFLNEKGGQALIPAITMCHSGMTKAKLPVPLNVLNAVSASNSSDLQGAFASLQMAVGGRGRLKTDFSALAKQVALLESGYTVGASMCSLVMLLYPNRADREGLLNHCKNARFQPVVLIDAGLRDNTDIAKVKELCAALQDRVTLQVDSPMIGFSATSAVTGSVIKLSFAPNLVTDIADQILVG